MCLSVWPSSSWFYLARAKEGVEDKEEVMKGNGGSLEPLLETWVTGPVIITRTDL